MSFRRVGRLAATALGTLLWMSCGEVYRPVVIPVSQVPPNPQNFHEVFSISTNVPTNPGAVLQIDVSGDSDIGIAYMGLNPTHAAVLPNDSRVFVASAGSVITGDSDVITAFAPASDSRTATGIGNMVTYSLPNVGPEQSANINAISESGNVVTVTLSAPIGMAQVGGPIVISSVNIGGYDGSFVISAINGTTIQYSDCANLPSGPQCITGLGSTSGGVATVPLPTFCSYLPDFVATTQNNAVFVANYGVENGPNCTFASTDSVAMLNPVSDAISNIAYLPPSSHPIAMVETADQQNLYVLNQGSNTVMDLSPVDLSTYATIPVGNTPVWAVARRDSRRVYVVAQGSGTLIPIDTATNTILPSQTNLSVGAGANFVLYDPTLNRLYVTNPATGNVFVYSATGGVDLSGNANDTPTLLATIPMGSATTLNPNPPCPGGCSPVSVTALIDGSRFYVASYESEASCSDPSVGDTACIVPILTVFDAASLTVRPANLTLLPAPSPSLSLLTSPPFALTQYALPPVPSCVTPATYTPGSTRFRMFTTASTDGSHVYVSICDSGSIADIATNTNSFAVETNTPDTLMTDIVSPFGACTPGTCGSQAAITSFAILSNVVTFQAANNFIAGERVQISGLGVGTYLNGKTLTVLPTGLSGSQFQCNFTHADVPSTSDSGTAVGVPSATITAFSINNNVATFQAINGFTPGTQVSISGLSSPAGTQIDGLTLTVLATGLSSSQFEANLNLVPPAANVGTTTDSGTAVPIVQPQSPIFLLAGQ
jgi:DNA-binding beta-propeller fold protein YncE